MHFDYGFLQLKAYYQALLLTPRGSTKRILIRSKMGTYLEKGLGCPQVSPVESVVQACFSPVDYLSSPGSAWFPDSCQLLLEPWVRPAPARYLQYRGVPARQGALRHVSPLRDEDLQPVLRDAAQGDELVRADETSSTRPYSERILIDVVFDDIRLD